MDSNTLQQLPDSATSLHMSHNFVVSCTNGTWGKLKNQIYSITSAWNKINHLKNDTRLIQVYNKSIRIKIQDQTLQIQEVYISLLTMVTIIKCILHSHYGCTVLSTVNKCKPVIYCHVLHAIYTIIDLFEAALLVNGAKAIHVNIVGRPRP